MHIFQFIVTKIIVFDVYFYQKNRLNHYKKTRKNSNLHFIHSYFIIIQIFHFVQVRYFKASLDPPKKETKESRQLSDSIKRFLAKKDEEDRLKQIEEQKKKDELILLRSQDKKSFKRVQSMLNRTKSANKSVIEDAKDDVNTSVTMAG